MAGAIGANLLVGRILSLAANVANPGREDARNLAEGGFHSPETSCCECRFFHCFAPCCVRYLFCLIGWPSARKVTGLKKSPAKYSRELTLPPNHDTVREGF